MDITKGSESFMLHLYYFILQDQMNHDITSEGNVDIVAYMYILIHLL